jgi:hypothetical protein
MASCPVYAMVTLPDHPHKRRREAMDSRTENKVTESILAIQYAVEAQHEVSVAILDVLKDIEINQKQMLAELKKINT